MPYEKMWTDMRHDPWFVSLNLNHRGVWCQMIMDAKEAGDTGWIVGRSWSALGQQWGCDGKTCRKILGNFLAASRIDIFEKNGVIQIFIHKYKYYQELTEKERVRKIPRNGENPKKIPPILKQSKAKQTKEYSPIVLGLVDLLKKKILGNKPDIKNPNVNSDKWVLDTATVIDRIMRLDERKPEKVAEVIEWCQKNNFWKKNILSGDKLRKQFDKLEMQMKEDYAKHGNQHQETGNFSGRDGESAV